MQANVTKVGHRAHRHPSWASHKKSPWTTVLELNDQRSVIAGSYEALCGAIQRGADLRIHTDFIYNEHIDTLSDNAELVSEVSDFRVTYLVEDRWAAGIMSLRMSINPPHGFGPEPRMSFFMYNQDGRQAVARPYLDGPPAVGLLGQSPAIDHLDKEKYHRLDSWDSETNAPSSNFIYDFDLYRYLVCDDWQEVLSHTADGVVVSGSLESLREAFIQGQEIKVGIRGLCSDMLEHPDAAPDHTVFVQAGPGYYFAHQKLFCTGSQPVVRVQPNIPMRYTSGGWDFGTLMARTDGYVDYWICDPYTLRFQKKPGRYAIRWFVR